MAISVITELRPTLEALGRDVPTPVLTRASLPTPTALGVRMRGSLPTLAASGKVVGAEVFVPLPRRPALAGSEIVDGCGPSGAVPGETETPLGFVALAPVLNDEPDTGPVGLRVPVGESVEVLTVLGVPRPSGATGLTAEADEGEVGLLMALALLVPVSAGPMPLLAGAMPVPGVVVPMPEGLALLVLTPVLAPAEPAAPAPAPVCAWAERIMTLASAPAWRREILVFIGYFRCG